MIFQNRLLFGFTCILLLGCAASKQKPGGANALPATALQAYGRTLHNKNGQLELISSAAHVGFSFSGDSCLVYASLPNAGGHNYLQYELDGVYQKRIRIAGNDTKPITIAAKEKGLHTVWIYKATEAHTGAIAIEKIGGNKIMPLAKKQAPLIEFIGNSITCGAAADPSEVPCGTGQYHDQHNAYAAYGPRVARALGVNYILSSVSGIGVYRNWNSDGPTMPQVYDKIDFQENNTLRWNFETYTPAIVSIALGTNDFSGGDGKKQRAPFDSTSFVSHYIDFVKAVKAKYPAAQIALLSSAMIHGDARIKLQNCLAAVKQNIDAAYPAAKPVALHFFEPMQARGCTGHPNVDDHAMLAKELEPFFKSLLP